ncbi:hypothetical protein POVWA2_044710 [Plasmodium ovale wallikeri]|uniref:Uncharacterized protein n=1 Tax=Plasmodium ovale wallikeri TaxID=864142 RepID=A0A1A8ZG81_PLAOA|nr:hypothetical protein POVWA2_044710 [Plasmodium ovale wallikeri]
MEKIDFELQRKILKTNSQKKENKRKHESGWKCTQNGWKCTQNGETGKHERKGIKGLPLQKCLTKAFFFFFFFYFLAPPLYANTRRKVRIRVPFSPIYP